MKRRVEKKQGEMGGWLLFYIIILALCTLSVWVTIVQVIFLLIQGVMFLDLFSGVGFVIRILFGVLALLAFLAFVKKRKSAVNLNIAYLWLGVIFTLIFYVLIIPFMIVWAIVWTIYFKKSRRVEKTFVN